MSGASLGSTNATGRFKWPEKEPVPVKEEEGKYRPKSSSSSKVVPKGKIAAKGGKSSKANSSATAAAAAVATIGVVSASGHDDEKKYSEPLSIMTLIRQSSQTTTSASVASVASVPTTTTTGTGVAGAVATDLPSIIQLPRRDPAFDRVIDRLGGNVFDLAQLSLIIGPKLFDQLMREACYMTDSDRVAVNDALRFHYIPTILRNERLFNHYLARCVPQLPQVVVDLCHEYVACYQQPNTIVNARDLPDLSEEAVQRLKWQGLDDVPLIVANYKKYGRQLWDDYLERSGMSQYGMSLNVFLWIDQVDTSRVLTYRFTQLLNNLVHHQTKLRRWSSGVIISSDQTNAWYTRRYQRAQLTVAYLQSLIQAQLRALQPFDITDNKVAKPSSSRTKTGNNGYDSDDNRDDGGDEYEEDEVVTAFVDSIVSSIRLSVAITLAPLPPLTTTGSSSSMSSSSSSSSSRGTPSKGKAGAARAVARGSAAAASSSSSSRGDATRWLIQSGGESVLCQECQSRIHGLRITRIYRLTKSWHPSCAFEYGSNHGVRTNSALALPKRVADFQGHAKLSAAQHAHLDYAVANGSWPDDDDNAVNNASADELAAMLATPWSTTSGAIIFENNHAADDDGEMNDSHHNVQHASADVTRVATMLAALLADSHSVKVYRTNEAWAKVIATTLAPLSLPLTIVPPSSSSSTATVVNPSKSLPSLASSSSSASSSSASLPSISMKIVVYSLDMKSLCSRIAVIRHDDIAASSSASWSLPSCNAIIRDELMACLATSNVSALSVLSSITATREAAERTVLELTGLRGMVEDAVLVPHRDTNTDDDDNTASIWPALDGDDEDDNDVDGQLVWLVRVTPDAWEYGGRALPAYTPSSADLDTKRMTILTMSHQLKEKMVADKKGATGDEDEERPKKRGAKKGKKARANNDDDELEEKKEEDVIAMPPISYHRARVMALCYGGDNTIHFPDIHEHPLQYQVRRVGQRCDDCSTWVELESWTCTPCSTTLCWQCVEHKVEQQQKRQRSSKNGGISGKSQVDSNGDALLDAAWWSDEDTDIDDDRVTTTTTTSNSKTKKSSSSATGGDHHHRHPRAVSRTLTRYRHTNGDGHRSSTTRSGDRHQDREGVRVRQCVLQSLNQSLSLSPSSSSSSSSSSMMATKTATTATKTAEPRNWDAKAPSKYGRERKRSVSSSSDSDSDYPKTKKAKSDSGFGAVATSAGGTAAAAGVHGGSGGAMSKKWFIGARQAQWNAWFTSEKDWTDRYVPAWWRRARARYLATQRALTGDKKENKNVATTAGGDVHGSGHRYLRGTCDGKAHIRWFTARDIVRGTSSVKDTTIIRAVKHLYSSTLATIEDELVNNGYQNDYLQRLYSLLTLYQTHSARDTSIAAPSAAQGSDEWILQRARAIKTERLVDTAERKAFKVWAEMMAALHSPSLPTIVDGLNTLYACNDQTSARDIAAAMITPPSIDGVTKTRSESKSVRSDNHNSTQSNGVLYIGDMNRAWPLCIWQARAGMMYPFKRVAVTSSLPSHVTIMGPVTTDRVILPCQHGLPVRTAVVVLVASSSSSSSMGARAPAAPLLAPVHRRPGKMEKPRKKLAKKKAPRKVSSSRTRSQANIGEPIDDGTQVSNDDDWRWQWVARMLPSHSMTLAHRSSNTVRALSAVAGVQHGYINGGGNGATRSGHITSKNRSDTIASYWSVNGMNITGDDTPHQYNDDVLPWLQRHQLAIWQRLYPHRLVAPAPVIIDNDANDNDGDGDGDGDNKMDTAEDDDPYYGSGKTHALKKGSVKKSAEKKPAAKKKSIGKKASSKKGSYKK